MRANIIFHVYFGLIRSLLLSPFSYEFVGSVRFSRLFQTWSVYLSEGYGAILNQNKLRISLILNKKANPFKNHYQHRARLIAFHQTFLYKDFKSWEWWGVKFRNHNCWRSFKQNILCVVYAMGNKLNMYSLKIFFEVQKYKKNLSLFMGHLIGS